RIGIDPWNRLPGQFLQIGSRSSVANGDAVGQQVDITSSLPLLRGRHIASHDGTVYCSFIQAETAHAATAKREQQCHDNSQPDAAPKSCVSASLPVRSLCALPQWLISGARIKVDQ